MSKTSVELEWFNTGWGFADIGLVDSRMMATWHRCMNVIWKSCMSHVCKDKFIVASKITLVCMPLLRETLLLIGHKFEYGLYCFVLYFYEIILYFHDKFHESQHVS